jgi:hypothetical protein
MKDTSVVLVHSKVNPCLDLRGIEIIINIEIVWIMQLDGEELLHKGNEEDLLKKQDEGILSMHLKHIT